MNSLHYSKQRRRRFRKLRSLVSYSIHANCQTYSSSPLNSNYDNPLMSLNCPLQKKNSFQLQNVTNSFKKKMFRDQRVFFCFSYYYSLYTNEIQCWYRFCVWLREWKSNEKRFAVMFN